MPRRGKILDANSSGDFRGPLELGGLDSAAHGTGLAGLREEYARVVLALKAMRDA